MQALATTARQIDKKNATGIYLPNLNEVLTRNPRLTARIILQAKTANYKMIITRVQLASIVLQTKERIEIRDFPLVHFLLRVIPDLYKEHSKVTLVKLPLATTRATAKSN